MTQNILRISLNLTLKTSVSCDSRYLLFNEYRGLASCLFKKAPIRLFDFWGASCNSDSVFARVICSCNSPNSDGLHYEKVKIATLTFFAVEIMRTAVTRK